MFQGFEVKDFKCHEDYNEIKMPGLTVISGTNNSGKSSLLQAIYLLTRNKTEIHPMLALDEGPEPGGFSDILHKSKASDESIRFSVDFSKDILKPSGMEYLAVTFVYRHPAVFEHLSVGYGEARPVLSEMEFQFKKPDRELQIIRLEIIDEKDSVFYRVIGEVDNGYCKIQGIIPESVIYKDLETNVRIICSTDFETVRDYLSRLSRENIKYLKALRLSDFIDKGAGVDNYLGLAGEYTAEIMYKIWDNRIDFNKESGERFRFSDLFDIWVKKLLGSDYRIRSAAVESKDRKYRVTIEEIQTGLRLNLNQVGIGISQLLPIIVLILTSKEHDILLIENPEVHLHPKLQALFVDLCLFAVENNRKLVVETHSEHVINRLRYRIKKSPHYLEKVSVLFLDKLEGEVKYTDVHIDKDGKIDFWPENFFDQSYRDLMGLVEE